MAGGWGSTFFILYALKINSLIDWNQNMYIFQSWERLRLHRVLLTLILNLPLWGRIYIIWFIHKKPAPVYGLLGGWGGITTQPRESDSALCSCITPWVRAGCRWSGGRGQAWASCGFLHIRQLAISKSTPPKTPLWNSKPPPLWPHGWFSVMHFSWG